MAFCRGAFLWGILAELGTDTSSAITMFLAKSVREGFCFLNLFMTTTGLQWRKPQS